MALRYGRLSLSSKVGIRDRPTTTSSSSCIFFCFSGKASIARKNHARVSAFYVPNQQMSAYICKYLPPCRHLNYRDSHQNGNINVKERNQRYLQSGRHPSCFNIAQTQTSLLPNSVCDHTQFLVPFILVRNQSNGAYPYLYVQPHTNRLSTSRSNLR